MVPTAVIEPVGVPYLADDNLVAVLINSRIHPFVVGITGCSTVIGKSLAAQPWDVGARVVARRCRGCRRCPLGGGVFRGGFGVLGLRRRFFYGLVARFLRNCRRFTSRRAIVVTELFPRLPHQRSDQRGDHDKDEDDRKQDLPDR